jgi:hypothetical protein
MGQALRSSKRAARLLPVAIVKSGEPAPVLNVTELLRQN